MQIRQTDIRHKHSNSKSRRSSSSNDPSWWADEPSSHMISFRPRPFPASVSSPAPIRAHRHR
eukprot:2616618-Pleurochrysis_carterae.AAC.2